MDIVSQGYRSFVHKGTYLDTRIRPRQRLAQSPVNPWR